MITPTKTVCYAWTAPGFLPGLDGDEVYASAYDGLIWHQGFIAYTSSEIDRIIVREELV